MDSNRRTGRTTRTVLQAILWASETGELVIIVVPSASQARWTFDYAWTFARNINGSAVHGGSRISIPGGGQIAVMTPDEERRLTAGMPDYHCFEDID